MTRKRRQRQVAERAGSSARSDPVTQYALDVVEGRQVAGPDVRNACNRHLKDLERDDIWFDVDAAQTFIDFCEEVIVLAGGQFEGKPFIPEPWQAFVGGSIFGWKKANGLRRFRGAYVETAKGSGKTPLAASIGFYMLMADGEARAEVYACATDKEQADVLFRDAVSMYQQSPELYDRLLPRGKDPNITQLTYLVEAGRFKPLSREAASKSGKRTSCALVDEFHEHPDGEMVDKLEADFKFRRQPLMFIITNSGSDLHSACGKYHSMAQKVCSGEQVDDEFFAYVCGLDEEDDPWTDPSCWPKANPSLGVTIQESYIRARMKKAENIPDKRAEVERLNFCIWTDAEAAWISKRVWKRALHPFEIEDVAGRKAWAGLDLSRRRDLTSMSVVIEDGTKEITRLVEREDQGDAVEIETVEPSFLALNEFWLPAENIREREDQDDQPYSIWAEDGFLQLTAGSAVKMSWVARRLAWVAQVFDLQGIYYDSYAIDLLDEAIDDLGLDLPLVEHPQGFRRSSTSGMWMPSSIERTEEAIEEGRLRVRPSPILTWNISNCAFERDPQDNRKLSKRKASGRIDGAVALVMALGGAVNPRQEKPADSYLSSIELAVLD